MGEGKLVRDRIPHIIREDGAVPRIRVATEQEYDQLLRAKLSEEVGEFLASEDDPDELADILEVIHAITKRLGLTPAGLEARRAAKAAQRGAFDNRIIWLGNESPLA